MPINATPAQIVNWSKRLLKNGACKEFEHALAESLTIARFSSNNKLIDLYQDLLDRYDFDEELFLDYLFHEDRATFNMITK